MKKSVYVIFLMCILIVMVGCAGKSAEAPTEQQEEYLADEPYDYCLSDDDCICAGVHPDRNECFIGNKEYYSKYVAKGDDCPALDFCTGDGNLVIRCIGGRCLQMPECSFDLECGEGRRCVKNKCV